MSSTLTGVHPWARYALSERFSVWGAAGYGAGTLTLDPDGEDAGERAMQAGLTLALARWARAASCWSRRAMPAVRGWRW